MRADSRAQIRAQTGVPTLKDRASRLAGALVIFFALLGLLFGALEAARKPLWFDELSTLYLASQPTAHTFLQAEPIDAEPPLEPLLVKLSLALPLRPELSVRLPSLLAFVLAGCTVFFFVRRHGTPIAATLAAGAFYLGPARAYAIEARPYALLILLTGATLVCWQRSREAPAWRAGLALALAALTLSHTFGLLFGLIPVLCGEFARFRKIRMDPALATPILLGCMPFAFDVWLAHGTRLLMFDRLHGVHPAIAQPTIHSLVRMLWSPFNPVAPGFLILLILLTFFPWQLVPREQSQAVRSPVSDAVAAASIFLAAFLTWALGALSTHYFFPRYGAPVCWSAVVLLGIALGTRPLPDRLLSLAGLALAAISAGTLGTHLHRPPRDLPYAEALRLVPDDGLPIVAGAAILYPEAWWYHPGRRTRITFLANQAEALRTPDPVPETALLAYRDGTGLPLPLEDRDTFLRAHPTFYLLRSGQPGEWLPLWLDRHGYHAERAGRENTGLYLYSKSHTVGFR